MEVGEHAGASPGRQWVGASRKNDVYLSGGESEDGGGAAYWSARESGEAARLG